MAYDPTASIASILAGFDSRLSQAEAATPTPTPSPTLGALTLAAPSVQEGTAADTVLSGILGKTAGSTLSIADSAGNRFAVSGTDLITGTVATDYETATSHVITILESLPGATNTPRPTNFTITVTNALDGPVLSALALSDTSYLVGTAETGTIQGATAGSTITATGLPAGLTIDGPGRTFSWSGSGSAGTSTVQLTETLADSPNSPRLSSFGVVVANATPTTVTYTGAQIAPAIAGGRDTRTPGRIGMVANNSAADWMVSVVPLLVKGTKCGLAINPGDQPADLVEVRVGSGNYQLANLVNGYFEPAEGLLTGPETLVLYRVRTPYLTNASIPTDSTPVAYAYGVNPYIKYFSGWTSPGDGDGVPHTAQCLVNNALGGYSPAKVKVSGGSLELTDQVIGLQIMCSEDTIMVASHFRYVRVEFGNNPPVTLDCGAAIPGAASVSAPAGIAKPYVLTVIAGSAGQLSNQDGTAYPNMLSVGGTAGMVGRAAVSSRLYYAAFGDSITHADHNTGSQLSHAVVAARALGRMPAVHAISGSTIGSNSSRMRGVLQARTYTAAWIMADFIGRNSVTSGGGGDGFSTADQDILAGDISAFLATGAARLTMFGLFPQKFPNSSSQIQAKVTAANSPRVRFQSTAGSGYSVSTLPGDAVHPDDGGQNAAGLQVAADLQAADQ